MASWMDTSLERLWCHLLSWVSVTPIAPCGDLGALAPCSWLVHECDTLLVQCLPKPVSFGEVALTTCLVPLVNHPLNLINWWGFGWWIATF
mmetsp:Transcript_35717/g.102711  ORF Transcript_35717/g.102711 Transcript_35717/m.102711 type:complete len:91 (+) Transcript_35717:544-816(+)